MMVSIINFLVLKRNHEVVLKDKRRLNVQDQYFSLMMIVRGTFYHFVRCFLNERPSRKLGENDSASDGKIN